LGLDVNSFKFQSTGFNVNNGGLTFVYKVQLTNDIYFLPAIKLGYASSSVAIDNLIFEDQINAVTGFINTETNDPLAPQISSINYIDLGTSFIVHNEVFIAGLSLRNLNQPNASFNKESAEKLPISISVQGGYEFDLNSYRQGLLPEFSFLYLYGAVTKFGNSIQVSLSQEAQLGSFSLGISQQASKLNTFSLTSVGLLVGVSVENFDFGLQYNIPIKQINQVFAPSIFELYVAFDFSIYRRNNRGRYKRLVTDNY
jgi:type IX secretion system PorP/SprF family membrane protein